LIKLSVLIWKIGSNDARSIRHDGLVSARFVLQGYFTWMKGHIVGPIVRIILLIGEHVGL